MPGAGFISLRDAIFSVGVTYTRLSGLAKGDAIRITQTEDDSDIIEGSGGDATFVMGISNVRMWELLILPTADEITLLQQLKATGVPWPFKYEFGKTKLGGFAIMSKDVDIVVSNTPTPITASGKLWLGNKKIGAQGISLT